MNYFEELAQNFGQQLIRPRKYNYSEQLLEHFFNDNPELQYRFTKALNKRQQLLETLLVKKTIHNGPSKTCIVYAHGLGSNKLEVLSILKHLKHFPYDVCSFDFSGSGKSQGKMTSFGLRQQDDVTAVLAFLDETQKYENYVLWGRSMGSVAIILSQGLFLNPKVKCIVLDSPFSSFEKVSLEIASKKSRIPQLFLQPLLNYLKQYFSKKVQINPFTMNITSTINKINCKILFIYSQKDSIVSYHHSKKLKQNCAMHPEQIQIPQDHNMQRSKQTHLKVHEFIQKIDEKRKQLFNENNEAVLDQTMKFEVLTQRGKSISRTRGISLTSKDSIRETTKQNYQSEANKGRKSTGNSGAKINLVTTQSHILKRKGSYKDPKVDHKLLKPMSSMQFTRPSSQSYRQEFKKRSNQKESQSNVPQSLMWINSVDTIQSTVQEPILKIGKKSDQSNNLQTSILERQSLLDITAKFTSTQNHSTHSNSTSLKYINLSSTDHQRHQQKLNSFYSASFMDENLNLFCSINSVCLNRLRGKDSIKDSVKGSIKDEIKDILGKNISNLNGKENNIVNPLTKLSGTKQKVSISTIKRPSIQLRRKNRHLF